MDIEIGKDYKTKIYLIEENDDLSVVDDDRASYIKGLGFHGKLATSFIDLGPSGSDTILLGVGEKEKMTTDSFRLAGFKLGKILDKNRVKEASIEMKPFSYLGEKAVAMSLIEGILHSNYSYDAYKKKKSKNHIGKISFESQALSDENIEEARTIVEGCHLARDLVNEPAIDLYPESLAQRTDQIFQDLEVDVDIYDKVEIEEMGMEAFLAVGQGSDKSPRFIVINYLPLGRDEEAVALVGKGITYDSGGYAIKSAKGMVNMKSDMAGAASVIGSIYSLAKMGVKKNVIGVIAACENMISGSSYKNGDIIGSMKGTTIEVGNTDCEGRVSLADSLYYAASKLNSSCIIDMATLTGDCYLALGDKIAGAFTNKEELLEEVKNASSYTGEKIWQLPMPDCYRDQVKGDVGDIKNQAGIPGATTAALFLEHFVEGKDWVHLDIAGPAFASEEYGYRTKGGTGFPVKTLYTFVKNYK